MPVYDIFHLPALNWITVLYFFFGGLAGGSFLLSFWAGYERKKLIHLAKPAAVITPIALVIGLAMLLLHLERPFQFWRIMITFKYTSTTSWGSWVLTLFLIVSVLYAFLWLINKGDSAKTLGWIGVPLAMFVAMYTGLLLMQMSGNPLWDSALLPWIFLIGGLLSAIAVSILVMTITGQQPDETFFGLKRYICTLIIIELLMVGSEFVALYTSTIEAVGTADLLLSGELSARFIGLQIIAGSLVPLGLLATTKTSKSAGLHILVSVLLLIGVFTVRSIIVLAGQANL